jgi:hypothetical protein
MGMIISREDIFVGLWGAGVNTIRICRSDRLIGACEFLEERVRAFPAREQAIPWEWVEGGCGICIFPGGENFTGPRRLDSGAICSDSVRKVTKMGLAGETPRAIRENGVPGETQEGPRNGEVGARSRGLKTHQYTGHEGSQSRCWK